MNINDIQFPKFEFRGIDAKIQRQQEVIERSRKERKKESRCCSSDKIYYVNVSYQETEEFYEVDLRRTAQLIKQKIDEQVSRNEKLLQRVIEKQVEEDFRSAERQINHFIKMFQDDFERLLKERQIYEAEAKQIMAMLEAQKNQLNQYLGELLAIQKSLEIWKPLPLLTMR